MDFPEYRKRGKEMVDYIADYLENIRERRVFPNVKPGFLSRSIPEKAPFEGEPWENIWKDVEDVIMPGVTHWQSPHMHAYFPALNSFPSLLADMLSDGINCLGFTWASSPVVTELETIVMNWLGQMIGLPDDFLHLGRDSPGGGVIQTSASEATLLALLAGRTEAIRRYQVRYPELDDGEINSMLVAYCSDQAHSSVMKAGMIGLVKMRCLECDENLSLRGDVLEEAIKKDRERGLVPFFVCATLGTTGACSFDNLLELGPICAAHELWLHVDAAYAGTAFICPEYRKWLAGIDLAESMAFNPSKWMMVHFDCTAMWVKNSKSLHRTFNVDPLYLKHENSGLAIDYMHWQIPLSKRFRALKLWFVIRAFGISGLQNHVRESVRLAKIFEGFVLEDSRFEIPAPRHLGLVVFRLRGENELTARLLKRLNTRGNIHCVPAAIKDKYIIRFAVTSQRTTIRDLEKDWQEIKLTTLEIMEEERLEMIEAKSKVPLAATRKRNVSLGSSLILWNSTFSPQIVNGSFAAISDEEEFPTFYENLFSRIRLAERSSPSMQRRVKGILKSGKKFSLDSGIDLVNSGVQTCIPLLPHLCEDNTLREDISENAENAEEFSVAQPRNKHRSRSLAENPEFD